MVIAGSGNNYKTDDVEIVDLSSSSTSGGDCLKPKGYPKTRSSMVADFYKGEPVACGGYPLSRKCYRYSFDTDRWHEAPFKLKQGRGGAESVMLPNNSLLIMGGSLYLSTTELLSEDEFRPGPDLPEGMRAQCSVLVNSTHLISTGGYPNHAEVYLLELGTGEWTRLADMEHGRDGHACGLINGEEVVVAGGDSSETSSEIFSFKTMSWREGPNLPSPVDETTR